MVKIRKELNVEKSQVVIIFRYPMCFLKHYLKFVCVDETLRTMFREGGMETELQGRKELIL